MIVAVGDGAIGVDADNRADISGAADVAVNKTVINRAKVVGTRNATDLDVTAEVGINQRNIFNRAVFDIAEQADVTAVAR